MKTFYKLLGTQLYLAEWFIWPPAQFVNFYFLPTRFRVIYDNVISLGYDMYTSHVKHSNVDKESTSDLLEQYNQTNLQSKHMIAKKLYTNENQFESYCPTC